MAAALPRGEGYTLIVLPLFLDVDRSACDQRVLALEEEVKLMLKATECAVQQRNDSDSVQQLLVSLAKIKQQHKQVFLSELQVT